MSAKPYPYGPPLIMERETLRVLPASAAPAPTWREKARRVIAPILAANAGKSRREIRKAMRAVYPFYADSKKGRAYRVWCDECAFALRERTRKNPRRHRVVPESAVMPSMRASVSRAGLLEITATLDVDLMGDPPPPRKTPGHIRGIVYLG